MGFSSAHVDNHRVEDLRLCAALPSVTVELSAPLLGSLMPLGQGTQGPPSVSSSQSSTVEGLHGGHGSRVQAAKASSLEKIPHQHPTKALLSQSTRTTS